MKLQTRIQKYADAFDSHKRDDNTICVHLKAGCGKKLHDSVMAAHGDKLPNDWVYSVYADLMMRLTEYTIESMDDVENYRSEIVDSAVDIYTAQLTTWLNESISNVDYLTQAIETYGSDTRDGAATLSMAQYLAIDEIIGEIINLLQSK